jgi:peptide/nickel transport system ATP-binding protein
MKSMPVNPGEESALESTPFIVCNNLVKIYKVADLEVVALQGLDLEVARGEMMALVGPSGSGKSTLLNVVGGLDTPSAGEIHVGGHDLLNMDDSQRVGYKRDVVGFVWQQPARNLLSYLTAQENVELPLMLAKYSAKERRDRAMNLLELLGLEGRANFRPDRLSGGEQQLVALAVALSNNPSLLLADEPTGQLDSESAARVFDALREINQTYQTSVIVVTHDPQVAARVDRVVGIRDGRTSTEIRRERNQADGTLLEEEWVILDRTGRLQIPQVYVETLVMHGRVKVRLESNHISVWPAPDEIAEVKVWRPDKSYQLVDEQVDFKPIEERPPAVETHGLWRTFQVGVEQIDAVRDVSITVPSGVLAVIRGRSGAGKTTLLNLIGGIDKPTKGKIQVAGKELENLSSREKVALRRTEIGYVFQTFGLLPFLSAMENVEAPMRLLLMPGSERTARAQEVLSWVGLTGRANHRTFELSGGEQQRVAISRSMANRPSLILADEPTGQLDTVTGSNIIALLKALVHQTGTTVIVASHDPKVEEAADCVYELFDGKLIHSEMRF